MLAEHLKQSWMLDLTRLSSSHKHVQALAPSIEHMWPCASINATTRCLGLACHGPSLSAMVIRNMAHLVRKGSLLLGRRYLSCSPGIWLVS